MSQSQLYKFTIITVCRNIASTIRRTCESIVNQTFQDFQWIVVDGASTDGTLDILKEYSNRIDILISEPDKGIYNAMNKGIKLATGEYVNFMNGGDEFYNNKVLEKVINYGLKDDVVYGNEIKINDQKSYLFNNWDNITNDILLTRHGITHQSSFTKAKLLKKYKFDEKYIIAADFDFFINVFQKGYRFYKIPDIINIFYENGISINMREKVEQEYIQIRKKRYKITFFFNNHPRISNVYNFIKNSIKYPRYFGGWIIRFFKR